MSISRSYVLVGEDGYPERIFRTMSEAALYKPEDAVKMWPTANAKESIRRKVWDRAQGCCEYCGRRITFQTGHMHEDHARGKRDKDGKYGEISVANSRFICAGCHTVRSDSEHGDRRWQTAVSPLFEEN